MTPPITLNQLIEDGLITKEEMKDPFNEKGHYVDILVMMVKG